MRGVRRHSDRILRKYNMGKEFDDMMDWSMKSSREFKENFRAANDRMAGQHLSMAQDHMKETESILGKYRSSDNFGLTTHYHECSLCGKGFNSILKYDSWCSSCSGIRSSLSKRSSEDSNDDEEEEKSESCCYITSACLDDLAISRNAPEMKAMKVLTKKYILKSFGGRRDYISYGRRAPKVVEAIRAREDAPKIWAEVYEGLKKVSARVVGNHFREAHQDYKSLVLELENRFVKV